MEDWQHYWVQSGDYHKLENLQRATQKLLTNISALQGYKFVNILPSVSACLTVRLASLVHDAPSREQKSRNSDRLLVHISTDTYC
jgi:uncharacterized protein YjaG (DUF416 family)